MIAIKKLRVKFYRIMSLLLAFMMLFSNSSGIVFAADPPAEEIVAEWVFTSEGDKINFPATNGIYQDVATITAEGGPAYENIEDSDDNGLENSLMFQGWHNGIGTKYWLAAVRTKGFENIKLSSVQSSSGSGPRDFKVQISLDNQATWEDVSGSEISIPSTREIFALSNLPLQEGAKDKDMLYIRWVVTSTTATNSVDNSSVGEWGTGYFKDVVIKGTRIEGGTIEIPTVVRSKSPNGGANSVDLNVPLTVTFNKPITLVDGNDVTIKDEEAEPVAGVSVEFTTPDSITINHADLQYETTYTVTVPKELIKGKDDDILLTSDLVWSFTTKKAPDGKEVIAEWFFNSVSDKEIILATGGRYKEASTIGAEGGPKFEGVYSGSDPNRKNSIMFQGWNNGVMTKYWLAAIPTKGYEAIALSSIQTSSGSGPRDFKVQISWDEQQTWHDVEGSEVGITGTSELFPISDLSLEGAENKDMLYIRWVVTSTTATNSVDNDAVGPYGTGYIKDVVIKGKLIESETIELPTVGLSKSPRAGADAVEIDQPLIVKFNKDITLLEGYDVVIRDDNGPITGISAEVIDDNTLRINHPDFKYERTYSVSIPKQLIKGTDNISLKYDIKWSFKARISPKMPKLLNMTFNGNPKTSKAFAWYTDEDVTGTQLQVVEASKVIGGVFPTEGIIDFTGTTEIVNVFMSEDDRDDGIYSQFASHKAIASDLEPGTRYAYRVGNGDEDGWGRIGYFKTDAEGKEDFHFVVGSDSHAEDQETAEFWKDTLRKAIDNVNPEFFILTGDLVSYGDQEPEWQSLLGVPKEELANLTLVPVLGGHEVHDYDGDENTDTDNFFYHFNLPEDAGIGGRTQKGSVYAFEYGNALFMQFNSQFAGELNAEGEIDYDEQEFYAQLDWMKNQVAKSDAKWKFVSFHKGPYSIGDNGTLWEQNRMKFYRKYLIPVFDELGVDAVFVGHDHMYMRSYQMLNDVPQLKDEAYRNEVTDAPGTVYMMTNSVGHKFYDRTTEDEEGNPIPEDQLPIDYWSWIDEQPDKKMFVDVSVKDDELILTAYTAKKDEDLEVYDQYTINRNDTKPEKVENPAASISGDQAVLSWEAPTGATEPIRGYRIYEKNDKVAVNWSAYIPAEEGKTEYTFSVGINTLRSYEFIIKSVGVRNNSDPLSVKVNEDFVDEQAPTKPTNLRASNASLYALTIRWNESRDNIKVKEYKVYRDGVLVGITSDTFFKDAGLNTNTIYNYHVVAYDLEDNQSQASASISVRIPRPSNVEVNFPAHSVYTSGVIKPNHITQAKMDSTVLKLYKEWKAKYLKTNPYEMDQKYVWYSDGPWFEAEDGVFPMTVSEAHGYGMLITAMMGLTDPDAKANYDALYRYYKAHPSSVNPDLMAWQQGDDGTAFIDINGVDAATDGDMDIAYSLILADRQWGSSGDINYLEQARRIIQAIMADEVSQSNNYLLVGDWAPGSSYERLTRSSDFMLQHMKTYREVSGDSDWDKVVDKTYQAINEVFTNESPETGILPDFMEYVDGKFIAARGDVLEGDSDGQMSYNACRTPWRVATDYIVTGDDRAKAQLDALNNWIKQQTGGNPENIFAGYELDGTAVGEEFDMAFSAPFMVSAMVNADNQQWLNDLWDYNTGIATEDDYYFANCIRLISMFVVSGNWWSPLSMPSAPSVPSVPSNGGSSSQGNNNVTIPAGSSGQGSIGDEFIVTIPAGAQTSELLLSMERVLSESSLIKDQDTLLSWIVEIKKNIPGNFNKPVTIKLKFNSAGLKDDQSASIFYYDEDKKEWVEIGGNVDGDYVVAEVDHFTKFAVFAVDKKVEMAPSFSDTVGHPEELNIRRARTIGLVSGYPDGSFGPDQTITRTQFVAMLMNLMKPEIGSAPLTFTDKDKIAPYARKAIAQAVKLGIINGYPDGRFGPDDKTNHTQAAIMIAKALMLDVSSQAKTGFADDAEIPAWAKGFVKAITDKGIVINRPDNKFTPLRAITRAEAVVLLLKMYDLKN